MDMSTIHISKDAYIEVMDYLKSSGHQLNILEPSPMVYPAIACHPDIFMCALGKRGKVFHGSPETIGYKYPDDIVYNGASTGRFFIHRLDKTNEALLNEITKLGLTLVDVKQGYSKCNVCIVDETHIITSDEGIARACQGYDIYVLLISPGHIALPGMSCGFIGGASGLVGNEVIFNGDLSLHPDFEEINQFILSCGKRPIYFKGKPLLDIGSIIEEL